MKRRDFVRAGVVASAAVFGRDRLTAAEAAIPNTVRRGTTGTGPTTPGLAAEARLRRARPIPLTSVRLTGGPLKAAQDLDAGYLLRLDPDRMLAYYRERAGLQPRAKPYGGWDGGGRNLTGHIAGHHLSAVSLMWAATGDARFRERADYMVAGLRAVQDANGDGYLGALEGGRAAFEALSRGEIRSSPFDLNGLWSPWYTLHKTFAGLRDAYRFTGSRTALETEARFAAWAEHVLTPLSEEQIQHMLGTEFGGMNQVLADLYADTGEERWLALSFAFEDRSITGPLQRHEDPLSGTHANTQVPKLIGSIDRFAYTGRAADAIAAAFFMDGVARHHSFATGGHGKDEYFGPPDVIGGLIDGRTAESCNVYNMLKLARRLFEFEPDGHYADFQERALYNHALGSIAPNGDMCYMVPVGQGVTREYQDMLHSFTCCVGTGMENHALHGYGIYYEEADTPSAAQRLWVNLYAPTRFAWADTGVELLMETDFPEGDSATLRLAAREPRDFTLSLRRPYWTGDGFAVRVNGRNMSLPARRSAAGRPGIAERSAPSDYVELARTWKDGDIVEIALPKPLRLERTPDDPHRAAILWGPIVLAGDIGPEPPHRREADEETLVSATVPVLVTDGPIDEWLRRAPGSPAKFRTVGVGREPNSSDRPLDADLVPFYRLHRRISAAYWDVFTPGEWPKRRAEYAAEEERLRALDRATVAYIALGDEAAERSSDFRSAPGVEVRRLIGRTGRSGPGWFSVDMPVEPTHPMSLLVTYYSDDRRSEPASFRILVDSQPIASERVERSLPARFYDADHPIPPDLLRGKRHVTVRFEADERSRIAAVFGLRMIRADQSP